MPSRAQICYIARTMNGWTKSDYLAWMMTVLRWRQTCSMAPTADRGRWARIWAHLVSNDSNTSDSEEHCFVKFGSAKVLVRRVKGITNSRHVGGSSRMPSFHHFKWFGQILKPISDSKRSCSSSFSLLRYLFFPAAYLCCVYPLVKKTHSFLQNAL